MSENPEMSPRWQELKRFLDASRHESDRGLALICAAMIDDLLGKSIQSFLVDHEETRRLLEGFNAPLGNLAARTVTAFALGILSETEYHECERIRKVRNVFAHNVHVSFAEQKVVDLCANLEFSWGEAAAKSARGQYATAAALMILRLTDVPDRIIKERLTYRTDLWGIGPVKTRNKAENRT